MCQLGDIEHYTYIRGSIPKGLISELVEIIKKNKGLFAWSASNMPIIHPNVITHKLSLCREPKPIAQKWIRLGEEKRMDVLKETQKLLQAIFIQDIKYTTWLANVVMVKNSNGKWRMCTNYTYLNKACPKDSYLLSSIDWLVDGASTQTMFTFLDAYSGYNQIPMFGPNILKTVYSIEGTNYYYQVMPFGFKNARATYQRLIDMVFW